MSKVSIRTRPKKDGVMASIFLEFSPPLTDPTGLPVRYEFLDLEKYIKPANHIQKNFNSTVDEIAEGIRCERYLKYVHKNYDWVAKNNPNGDFLDYFDKNIINRGIKFKCSLSYFSRFCKHECKFKNITVSYCEQFKNYLLNTEGLHRKQKLSNNSAASYFNAFMSIVQLAQSDGIIRTDIFSKVSRIVWSHDTNKEYLNPKEIKRIKRADFPEHPDLKRAVLFSIYTGLRRADILKLDWKDIYICGEKSYMKIIISKTKIPATLPLSMPAIKLLGKPKGSGPVFENLSVSIIHKWLPVLMRKAKITKHITFHCFRHTFAMQLLETGADIYTIVTLLGHKSVTSTQVYARMSPEEAREAILRLI